MRGKQQTYDGHEDHTKVKDVPRLLEIVPSQCDYLHETLDGEDANKYLS